MSIPDKTPGPVLDEEILSELRSLYAADARHSYIELIETFQQCTRKEMDRLREAIQSGDWEQAATLAHAVKGTAANFGAAGMSALVAKLEHLVLQRAGSEINVQMQAVEEEFERVQQALEQEKLPPG